MHYHALISSILIALLSACSGNDQKTGSTPEEQKEDSSIKTVSTPPVADTPPRTVEDIQKAYELISIQKNQGLLDSASFKYDCRGEKNGEVSYFSKDGQLRMIVHRYNEYSHHSAADHYYIMDSVLFFVYNNRLSWTFDSGPQGSTKDDITEQRIYLIDQKPLRCLEKKFVVRSKDVNNPKSEMVANKVVDCKTIKSVVEPFQLLMKYRGKGTVRHSGRQI
jgi:hypothetical protein